MSMIGHHIGGLAACLVACGGQSTVTSGERGKGPEDVIPATALAADSCDDARLVTVEEIAGGKINGERVALDIVPVAHVECTELDCDDRECCNKCEGGYGGAALRREPADRDLELSFTGLPGCSGMDCNLYCEPFGRAPKWPYRFVGTLSFEAAGTHAMFHQATIQIEKYCRMN